jgi:hypothetical protein
MRAVMSCASGGCPPGLSPSARWAVFKNSKRIENRMWVEHQVDPTEKWLFEKSLKAAIGACAAQHNQSATCCVTLTPQPRVGRTVHCPAGAQRELLQWPKPQTHRFEQKSYGGNCLRTFFRASWCIYCLQTCHCSCGGLGQKSISYNSEFVLA